MVNYVTKYFLNHNVRLLKSEISQGFVVIDCQVSERVEFINQKLIIIKGSND